ncbi:MULTISPECIES: alpha/beta fold hydrolase [unclassified Herbaspirillum]|uniref:alpha/beta fold hydrolase n=1 Tax=unclassified Herbaspirillum TaxID=2624150 RepID=UPI001609A939|nr:MULTISPECIES: alpha/beta hydrolase [unclassified Herbaspirillum]
MTQAALKTVQCISPAGLHTMAYKEWGDPHNPNVLVCVHGVTRVSDDFDIMAREFAETYRVICPDVVGRGRSGKLRNPQYYVVPQYVSDMVCLLARLDAETVDWFGTSMGGLIGMALASLPENPIRRLVLNDIGPSINASALARIGEYIGQDIRFDSFDEAALYIRTISASFGPHTDEQWHKLASDVLRQDEQGKWRRHYDLALAEPFKTMTPEAASMGEAALWAAYDAITCPTLLVRGSASDLLLPEVAQAMTQRGPRATLVEVPGVGHAPTFVQAEQIKLARDFLLGAAV